MEAKEEQITIKNACCICGKPEMMNSHNIIDSFIKNKDSFVPFVEVIHTTLNFVVSSNLSCVMIRQLNPFLHAGFEREVLDGGVRVVQSEACGLLSLQITVGTSENVPDRIQRRMSREVSAT